MSTNINTPMQLAFERGSQKYEAGSMTDGRKLGLAIGSGGGAGPVSLGGLSSLQELDVLGSVDSMYGVSVGAINLAAFAAGQTEVAIGGYERMTEADFVKFGRVLRIMDMGVLKTLLNGKNGLDTEAVVESKVPINVGVTRLSGGLKPQVFDLSALEPEDVVDVLVWGASIPGVSGLAPRDKKGIGGGSNTAFADGGFSHLSAVDMAAQDGCTDVIYLSNQPFSADKYRAWQVGLFGTLMTPYDTKAISNLRQIVKNQISSRRPFADGTFQYGDVSVDGLFPPGQKPFADLLPSLFNKDPRKIMTGFDISKLHILDKLSALMPDLLPNATQATN